MGNSSACEALKGCSSQPGRTKNEKKQKKTKFTSWIS